MLCIRQKNLLDETVLFSTKIMLKLMDTWLYTVNITLNFFLTRPRIWLNQWIDLPLLGNRYTLLQWPLPYILTYAWLFVEIRDKHVSNDMETILYTAAIWSYLFLGPYFCRMGILYLNYKPVIIRPPGKRHLNGVSLTCQWWSNIECNPSLLWCLSGFSIFWYLPLTSE